MRAEGAEPKACSYSAPGDSRGAHPRLRSATAGGVAAWPGAAASAPAVAAAVAASIPSAVAPAAGAAAIIAAVPATAAAAAVPAAAARAWGEFEASVNGRKNKGCDQNKGL